MIGTALLALQLAAVSPAAPARPPLTERRTVVVDAGHGGPDRGMTGPIGASRPLLIEKDVTLSVAKRVAAVLERRGMRVIMTRTADTLIALADRGHIANEAGGDVFLSIHVNAANPRWKNASAARGYETYFLADAKTEDARRVAELENASERFEAVQDTRKGDPLRFILTDMQQNEHLRESSELAAIVQRHLGRVQHGPSRGVKQAGFKVLVTASCRPSWSRSVSAPTPPRRACCATATSSSASPSPSPTRPRSTCAASSRAATLPPGERAGRSTVQPRDGHRP
ncbi:MAG TPA: N-acetylmuramoyl-L-alanine amidase, partial [Gemmatimonadaceae bacterium]